MQFDLMQILNLARRWWWLLVLAPMIGGTTALIMSERQPEMYSASATLLLTGGVNTNNIQTIQAGQNLTGTYSRWIVSYPVLERAASTLQYEGGAEDLEEHVSAETVADTLFITVSATDESPERAALIADTVANEFIATFLEQAQTQSAQASRGINEQITSTNDAITELDTAIGELESVGDALTEEQNAELEALRGQRAERQAQLNRLEERVGILDVELASAQTQIVVSSPAVPPTEPYAPTPMRSTAIGIAAGLTLAVAAAALIEYFDNTIKNREELTAVAEAPVLATVARAQSTRRGETGLFMLQEPKSASAEAIRLLRANLEFASAPDYLRSVSVTSAGSGEGKSTITANLGIAFAQAGLRTAIVDADLRKPVQHELFGSIENARGLSTLLATHDPDWRRAAKSLTIQNLILIPSGPVPPNPAELLSLDRFNTILEDIHKWADVVLIDSPPILSTSDALVIATKVEGTILVCRANQTRTDEVKRSRSFLNHARANLMGTVLNLIPPDDTDLYGQYTETAQPPTRKPLHYYFGGKYDSDSSDSEENETIEVRSNGHRPKVPAGSGGKESS